MRKLEESLVRALACRCAWSGGNTMVATDGTVYLHGNRIAYRPNGEGPLVIDWDTFDRWPTATTKSRLRALGLNYKTGR